MIDHEEKYQLTWE